MEKSGSAFKIRAQGNTKGRALAQKLAQGQEASKVRCAKYLIYKQTEKQVTQRLAIREDYGLK